MKNRAVFIRKKMIRGCPFVPLSLWRDEDARMNSRQRTRLPSRRGDGWDSKGTSPFGAVRVGPPAAQAEVTFAAARQTKGAAL